MQLRDFDAVPVERTVGFVFSFTNGRATLVSDRTSTGKPLFRGNPAPWDLTAISVREEPGVLGIFDRRTKGSAATVVAAVRDGIAQLDRALPFSWSGKVVVYSVEDPRVLASFRDVPGGAIEHLGAMTFPTYAEDEHSQVASTRMLLMPSSVRAGQPFLGRITRHELSHVAIGVRDDGAPTWVSEGIAEYLGAREVPVRERIIPTVRAAAGPDRRRDHARLERLQRQRPGVALRAQLDGLRLHRRHLRGVAGCGSSSTPCTTAARAPPDVDQDRVLDQVLGFDSHELGRRAAARIRNIYG